MQTLRSIPGYSALVVIDVQERLCQAMPEPDALQRSVAGMIQAAGLLGCNTIVTEQYPKGLGHTIDAVSKYVTPETPVLEKTAFSCWGSDEFTKQMLSWRPETLVLVGVETHVCVQQTALAAVARGYATIILADAVASQRTIDKQTALNLLRSRGVTITTTEALVFDWLKDSTHPRFKEVSGLFK